MTAGTPHRLPAGATTVHRGSFSADIPPVLTISSGDTVDLTTLSGGPTELPGNDAGFTVLREHEEVLAHVPAGDGPHLLTGPIAVGGARPGDELAVELLSIELIQDWGWNLILPGEGTLPEDFPDERWLHAAIDRERGVVRMPWGLELPAEPFFGIIGVAPRAADGARTSLVPGEFGGNVDVRQLRPGATLHLPVLTRGALLSLGDGHAVQGDGEVCLTAIETALRGKVRVTVEPGTGITSPWAETPSAYITMGFDEDLDEAARIAVREMIALIQRVGGHTAADAYTLCSIAADLRVSQLVNISKGIHMILPRRALARS